MSDVLLFEALRSNLALSQVSRFYELFLSYLCPPRVFCRSQMASNNVCAESEVLITLMYKEALVLTSRNGLELATYLSGQKVTFFSSLAEQG